jgi:DNA-binding beta-propeller fold protein YncE
MNWKLMTGVLVLALSTIACGGEAEGPSEEPESTPTADVGGFPTFELDPSWPELPNNWVLGECSSVAVDGRDHIWVLHRPRTVPEEQRDNAAPPVLEFDDTGMFVAAWGGPGEGYDWPWNEHGIHVDHNGHVWIGGNNPTGRTPPSEESDDMLLKFTNAGEFLMQIGGRNQSEGNLDTDSVKKSAEMFVYPDTNEVFVADGYGNRRVIVFDADTGEFKRMWAAFGNEPTDTPPEADPDAPDDGQGPPGFGTVHGIEVSNDGLVYVADRNNSRIQIFDLEGNYLKQVFINQYEGRSLTAAGLAFSPDPEQRFMYVADQANLHIHVLDRQSLEVLDSWGELGTEPGTFDALHHLAVDSKGNLYTAEAQRNHRVQRFMYAGMGN